MTCHPLRYCLSALLAAGAFDLPAAGASTATVPDAFATVQAAIDAGVDTVLVREGAYPEQLVVDHALVLEGAGAGRTQVSGLTITNSNFPTTQPLLSVRGLRFSGPVHHATVSYRPRLLEFRFLECVLDSGFYQLDYLDPEDVSMLSFRNCRLGGLSAARVSELVMAADTIDGGVSWNAGGMTISDCWFRGGPGAAISLHTGTLRGAVEGNRIENYAIGIAVENIESECRIERNVIRHCGGGMQLGPGYGASITGNTIRECGTGVEVRWLGTVAITENRILNVDGYGVLARVFDLVVERNVIGGCGGAGISVDWGYWTDLGVLRGNTVLDNAGSGMELRGLPGQTITVEGNAVVGNGGWGLVAAPGSGLVMGCNDWFENVSGAVAGVGPGATDVSVAPLFCNADSADVYLDSGSPLANAEGCGQIGALGVGCGPTATVVQLFSAGRVGEGIRVAWEVADGVAAAEIWLERSGSREGQGWIRPKTERSVAGGTTVELDRSAMPGQVYWYRLVAQDERGVVVVGSPIWVGAETQLGFKLVDVGPSPGNGTVRVGFALQREAFIEIEVFDVQGRRVAFPGRGTWPAGTHAVGWNGQTSHGDQAPSGLYLLRYRFPGGEDRRRIVRAR